MSRVSLYAKPFDRLEPYEGKLSRTVLRGGTGSNVSLLPDNVLHNEFKKATFKKYFLKKEEDGQYSLTDQPNDAPFSYHLFLKAEIEKAIQTSQIQKYHFNFLRNILEKTSTFLGYKNWGELLPKMEDGKANPYESRIINISSHSKHSAEEIVELTENDKRVLAYLLKEIKKNHKFNHWEGDI